MTTIDDFKKFLEVNREKIDANAINADDITIDDEWMKDNIWDKIYKENVDGNE